MNPFYHHRFRKRADGGDVRRRRAEALAHRVE
jgi:hypothetical protein